MISHRCSEPEEWLSRPDEKNAPGLRVLLGLTAHEGLRRAE